MPPHHLLSSPLSSIATPSSLAPSLSHGAFFPCVRLVFTRAFAEIRFMLESNLMLKFVSTDEFGKALSAARHEHDGC